MNNIVINNVTYHVPMMCCELSIAQSQLATEIYKTLKTKEQALSIDQSKQVLTKICRIDRVTVDATDKNDMAMFTTMLIKYLYNLITSQTTTNQSTDNECFKNGTEVLYLPRNGKTFDGDIIPMCDITAEQMCDATDLYIADSLKYTPLIAAILCFPKDQPYDSDLINQKANCLRQLKTDKAIKILALVKDLHRYAKEIFPHCYSTSLSQKESSKNIGLTWNDLLMMTANYIPSEIKIISQMNCYDFLRIVNSKNSLNKKFSNA